MHVHQGRRSGWSKSAGVQWLPSGPATLAVQLSPHAYHAGGPRRAMMRIFLTICRASVIMRHVVLMRLHQYCKRSSPILGQSPPRVPITGRSKPCMWKRSFQPWPRRSAVVLFSLVLAVLLAGCFPSHSQSTFDAAGPIAEKQLNLWHSGRLSSCSWRLRVRWCTR